MMRRKDHFAGFADRYVSGKLLNYFNKELLFQQRYFASLEPEVVNNIPAGKETNQLSFLLNRSNHF
ncbi:hypothetical protein KHA80_12590 [Anaerobacillus sp. HL2]|nr:hypothetical protein KHA80_12590 [Anaerobacillus sp. HL2]